MLNVVARPEGRAAAILIRAAAPIEGTERIRSRRPKAKNDRELLAGPGRVAQGLDIDSRYYGLDLLDEASEVRLEPGTPPGQILQGVRVGLSQGRGEHTRWRFVDAEATKWCSRPLRGLEPS